MTTQTIAGQSVTFHRYDTVVFGAGAAGMNCAVQLYDLMHQKGLSNPAERIAVVTGGLPLGASRMSGSDKQTYYKMGTSPDVPDSAEQFAQSLTAAGCTHGDLALAEAIGSLRGFYHLVQAGVPFPHDSLGCYIGYKTDHDPYERATSAGPKTSKFMSECLQQQLTRRGVKIYDHHEAADLITCSSGGTTRIAGIATLFRPDMSDGNHAIRVFLCDNLVLAAGGPGELYATSVYPKGQIGIHGLALRAGLVAENLTESQFGLASTKFRWNVSGTYMQAIPRIFSTDPDGRDEHDFLTDFFDGMSQMATNIFLKGYQWPFDPQRIENHQSSLIDVLVFNETQNNRRVFMDFRRNPIAPGDMKPFDLQDLQPEALNYLQQAGALQDSPIARLAHMNQPAIDIYAEHNIDLHREPLEIAVCAQHNNGGFAVDKWWQSNIPHTFVIGEMAGTHGVKRPGGSALNAGQVGALRAAQYIVNAPPHETPDQADLTAQIEQSLTELITRLDSFAAKDSPRTPQQVIAEIQQRMTASAAHIRRLPTARDALAQAIDLHNSIAEKGLKLDSPADLTAAIRAEHLALSSVAFLKAIVELLEQDSGSRGSHLVLSDDGLDIHPDVLDQTTGRPLRFKPENPQLRASIIRTKYDPTADDMFTCRTIPTRPMPTQRKAFEPAWLDYRQGSIYTE